MKKNLKSEWDLSFVCQQEGLSLFKFLASKDISHRLFRRLYREKSIFVDGKFMRKDSIVAVGAKVSLVFLDEENNIEAQAMDLDIIYEDEDILIINKGPNMVVHPTKSHQRDTLSNGISHYFKELGLKRRVRFVNRLDMDTSGALIVAKNPYAHQQMARQFEGDQVVKKYLTVVEGRPDMEEGYIDAPIARLEDSPIGKGVAEGGQEALSHYRILEDLGQASLLEVQIFTGRSHQIRVHMSHLGNPIIGDSLYNELSPLISRQALHSSYLKIRQIRSGKELEVHCPLPKDMEILLDELRKS